MPVHPTLLPPSSFVTSFACPSFSYVASFSLYTNKKVTSAENENEKKKEKEMFACARFRAKNKP